MTSQNNERSSHVRNPRTGKYDYSFRHTPVDALTSIEQETRQSQKAWQDLAVTERAAVLLD